MFGQWVAEKEVFRTAFCKYLSSVKPRERQFRGVSLEIFSFFHRAEVLSLTASQKRENVSLCHENHFHPLPQLPLLKTATNNHPLLLSSKTPSISYRNMESQKTTWILEKSENSIPHLASGGAE